VRILAFLCAAAMLMASGRAEESSKGTFVLVRDGKPQAVIVIAADAPRAAEFAAGELRYHVKKITGAGLPIVTDDAAVKGPRILVGESKLTRALGLRSADFAEQEYLVRFLPDALVLMGDDGDDSAATGRTRTPRRVDGKFGGRALEFNGKDDAVNIPECGFSDDAGTLEAWVWLPAETQDRPGTILRLDGTDPWSYHIIQRAPKSSRIAYRLYDGKKGSGVASSELSEGWHHVAATYDAKQGKAELFVDGVSQGATRYSCTTCAGAALNVGGLVQRRSGTPVVGNPFRGVIDEVRISNIVRRVDRRRFGGPYEPDARTKLLMHFDESKGRPRDSTGNVSLIAPPALFEKKGTLYAVYDFLEKFCGVRWYAPTEIGLVCPSAPTLEVRGSDIRRAPAMLTRWIVPTRMYIPTPADVVPNKDAVLWRLRMRMGGEPFVANHSFYGYYNRFLETHPEWFARGYSGRPPQMCYTNPEFIRQVVQDARDYFDGKPAWPGAVAMGNFFALVPMDTARWCKCARCQAELDLSQKSNPQFNNGLASPYIWGFVNKVAAEVRKTHPDKYLSALGYSSYAYYPTGLELEPNIAVQLCLHTRNWWVPSMEKNDRKVLNEWIRGEGGKRPVYVWLYYCFPALLASRGGYGAFPGFFAHTVIQQMKLFHKAGVRGIFMEHSSEVGLSFLLDQLEMHLTWKLADDPTLDGEKLIDKFFTLYYGAAAAPMKELYARLEETYSNPANYPDEIRNSPAHHHQTEELAWRWLGTEKRMAEFAKLMAEARTAAGTGIEKRRVALFEKGIWDYMVQGKKRYERKKKLRSAPPPSAVVPRSAGAGGDPSKADWSKAVVLGRWMTVMGDPTPRKVETRLLHDGDYFYVRMEEALDASKLVSAPDVWSGDDWEMVFALQRGKPYRHFCVAPNGTVASQSYAAAVTKWDSGAKVISDTSGGDRWVVQIAFPLDRLLPGPIRPGAKFYANFYRASPRARNLLAWSPNFVANFHELSRLGELTLK